ncbi:MULTISPECIES: DUF1573 domain-containing protein [unclassified Imperialibacter]|uniref:DUF1573 domain-containing protein n=1 Tax=unclassified Imperialibacter TaxID=2629706 RepID=UPI001256E1B4|nr:MULTISPECIES: DUF1573 domain-containing protein [unclassified Imperialibacter]CAD5256315.1 conserved exported hypothetical protein [Imperialibacter sp. 89]CAD5262433.1 conserved exported hypothetical protein [Imperialibacter sp. 75]VVT33220.1 conserved exported hypothetical protein [Imperialibacter sp. EC-SDR9]
MRKFAWLVVFMLASAVAVQAQDAATEKKGPEIKFEESTHDFGDITQGDKVEYVFAFSNKGTEPLILSRVLTTCGCTAPSWPKEPIAPGEKGEVKVSFNSTGKMGMQNKVITIISNATNSSERISITTNVLPKKEAGE